MYCSWMCHSTCVQKILGLYTHLIYWFCDLHMKYGIHIHSVIYIYMLYILYILTLYIELYIHNCNSHLP